MPNSTTGMTSEHVMKMMQQLTCQQTISFALVFLYVCQRQVLKWGHFTWGALQTADDKSSLLTNEQFRRVQPSVSFFQFSHVASKLAISHKRI
jgi:hypothetical protein